MVSPSIMRCDEPPERRRKDLNHTFEIRFGHEADVFLPQNQCRTPILQRNVQGVTLDDACIGTLRIRYTSVGKNCRVRVAFDTHVALRQVRYNFSSRCAEARRKFDAVIEWPDVGVLK